MIISVNIISNQGPYYMPISCTKLATFYTNATALETSYPICSDPKAWSMASANFSGEPENIAASFNVTFGAVIWLALTIHAIGVEFYVSTDSN